ncbi:hypothetical protein TTRE_0000679501 [Trichuris trichiura]|uniref:Uncharacterized protein n=1 Tax=Trichuris trichiura TaxID=36087 RepID=A0A077ZFY2_TRITR|nr:hypothetical protein TTRE_0000679501 [Trichuris trichiura]
MMNRDENGPLPALLRIGDRPVNLLSTMPTEEERGGNFQQRDRTNHSPDVRRPRNQRDAYEDFYGLHSDETGGMTSRKSPNNKQALHRQRPPTGNVERKLKDYCTEHSESMGEWSRLDELTPIESQSANDGERDESYGDNSSLSYYDNGTELSSDSDEHDAIKKSPPTVSDTRQVEIEVASIPDLITFDSDEEGSKYWCAVMDKADNEVSSRIRANEVEREENAVDILLGITGDNPNDRTIADNANQMNFLPTAMSLLKVAASGSSTNEENKAYHSSNAIEGENDCNAEEELKEFACEEDNWNDDEPRREWPTTSTSANRRSTGQPPFNHAHRRGERPTSGNFQQRDRTNHSPDVRRPRNQRDAYDDFYGLHCDETRRMTSGKSPNNNQARHRQRPPTGNVERQRQQQTRDSHTERNDSWQNRCRPNYQSGPARSSNYGYQDRDAADQTDSSSQNISRIRTLSRSQRSLHTEDEIVVPPIDKANDDQYYFSYGNVKLKDYCIEQSESMGEWSRLDELTPIESQSAKDGERDESYGDDSSLSYYDNGTELSSDSDEHDAIKKSPSTVSDTRQVEIEVASIPDLITFDSDEEGSKYWCAVMGKADNEVSSGIRANKVEREENAVDILLGITGDNPNDRTIADNANQMNFLPTAMCLLKVAASGSSTNEENKPYHSSNGIEGGNDCNAEEELKEFGCEEDNLRVIRLPRESGETGVNPDASHRWGRPSMSGSHADPEVVPCCRYRI